MIQAWERLQPCESYRGWWEVGHFDLPTLPVLAARGIHDGSLVVITGAIHGDEYEGPAAIHRFFNELDTATLSGTVIGLPIVNREAWQARSRVSPLDGMDLNRVFPGSTTGQPTGPSAALAQAVFTTFVRPCDVLVDLHSGGAKLVHLPMVGWYARDTRAEQLARTFDPALHPWLIPDRAGVLSCEARRAGKVALGAEWGGGAKLDTLGIAAYVAGLQRLIATLAGRSSELAADQRAPIAGAYQQVEAAGLFVADVALGATIAVGGALGRLYDPLGHPVATVRAEWAGMVAALAHNALLDAGDRVAYIG